MNKTHQGFLAQLDVETVENDMEYIKQFLNTVLNETSMASELYTRFGKIRDYIKDLEHEHEVAKRSGADDEYLNQVQLMIGEAREVRRRIAYRQELSRMLLAAMETPSFKNALFELNKGITDMNRDKEAPFYRIRTSESGVVLKYLEEQNKKTLSKKQK